MRPVPTPGYEFAVQNQAGRQLLDGGHDQLGKLVVDQRPTPRLQQHPPARLGRGEQQGAVAVVLQTSACLMRHTGVSGRLPDTSLDALLALTIGTELCTVATCVRWVLPQLTS